MFLALKPEPTKYTGSIFRYLLCVLVWMLLINLVVGCAPKRVLRGDRDILVPQTAKSTKSVATKEQKNSATDVSLPEPLYRGKSGLHHYRSKTTDILLGRKAVELARQQIGKQYQWGASGPERFDCSGLVQYVYGNLGVNLPRVSREQARAGKNISRQNLEPGDLLFFATTGSGINHVGIYLGSNEFIHAPRRHVPVKMDSLNNSWWSQRLSSARRIQ